ncbi:hypothetical protein [Massilia sp.]|uniref:hypothetical protein n=1 Tax=Massilia sp. TaxID=1882437 RepID=UPI00289B397E|nr:hypothetical protein [Massilia sp.]
MQSYRFSGSPRAFAQVLGIIIVCLLCANAIGLVFRFGFDHDYVMGLVPLFDVDTEGNIPTFFSVAMALFSVVLFTIIALDARHRASVDTRYWFVLAGGFLFLAYDEAFQVHEKMTVPMRDMLGKEDLGFLHYAWVVPALGAVLLATLFFLRFLLRLPAATRRRLLGAGALFLGGCIGMELINGRHFAAHGDTLFYNCLVMMEEGLEMAGLATLIYALVSHIAESGRRVEFDLQASRATPPPVLAVVPAVAPLAQADAAAAAAR